MSTEEEEDYHRKGKRHARSSREVSEDTETERETRQRKNKSSREVSDEGESTRRERERKRKSKQQQQRSYHDRSRSRSRESRAHRDDSAETDERATSTTDNDGDVMDDAHHRDDEEVVISADRHGHKHRVEGTLRHQRSKKTMDELRQKADKLIKKIEVVPTANAQVVSIFLHVSLPSARHQVTPEGSIPVHKLKVIRIPDYDFMRDNYVAIASALVANVDDFRLVDMEGLEECIAYRIQEAGE